MLQECSDVFGRLAGNGVEAFVGDRDRAVAKATQERLTGMDGAMDRAPGQGA